MHIEGIVLHKTLYKEKDLIAHLLLRSGDTLTVYFYGGKGGGKKLKGSIVEMGFMLGVYLQKATRKLESQIQVAKEYELKWHPKYIRENYQAFCLASFYLELIAKISSEAHIDDVHSINNEGLFKVLSNALFYLDEAVGKKSFDLHQHLFIFFAKF